MTLFIKALPLIAALLSASACVTPGMQEFGGAKLTVNIDAVQKANHKPVAYLIYDKETKSKFNNMLQANTKPKAIRQFLSQQVGHNSGFNNVVKAQAGTKSIFSQQYGVTVDCGTYFTELETLTISRGLDTIKLTCEDSKGFEAIAKSKS